MDLLPSAVKFYRLLLLAYPAEFRNEYGGQMEDVFAGRLASEPRLRVWLDTIADVFYTAPREHLSVLWGDLRYSAKLLAQAPSFTLVALLTTALGIGATTAVFSVMNAVLLKSLPYSEPERLVYIWVPIPALKLPGGLQFGPTAPEFYDLEKSNRSFERLATFNGESYKLAQGDGMRVIGGVAVTGDFFATLGTKPELGRAIERDDDEPGHDNVAVIGHTLWLTQFGGAPDVLGKSIRLNRKTYRVIGVMPPGFAYPHYFEASGGADTHTPEVWMPYAMNVKDRADRSNITGAVIARLRSGVSLKQAQTEVNAFLAHEDKLRPEFLRGGHASVASFLETAIGEVRKLAWLLMGAVLFVLLIACSNVANLLLARAATRVNEMGVRSALGADRSRLIRQILTESVSLSFCGGLLGVLFAFAAVRILVLLNPGTIPRLEETSVNGAVLAFALAVSLISGILFGLYPAFSLSRTSLTDLLKRTGNKGIAGSANHTRHALVVIEICLSVVLLAAAGLLIRSFLKLQNVNTGFAQSTLAGRMQLDGNYNNDASIRDFYRWLIEKTRTLPGIQQAGLISILPLSNTGSISLFDVEGYANKEDQTIENASATGDYFRAMNIKLLKGRLFDNSDAPNHPTVLIISEACAKKYFKGRNPLGGRVYFSRGTGPQPYSTVIGVVADVSTSFSLEAAPNPFMYRSFWQSPQPQAFLALQGTQTTRAMRTLGKIVHERDSGLAVTDVHSMSERKSEFEAGRRYQTVLLSSFAAAAFILALVGLYGLMSYSVRQRSAEIGVRMALGATRAQILGMVMKQGLSLTSTGLAIGLLGAAGVTRFLSSMVYEVGVLDPATFVAVPAAFLAVATAACCIPGSQATRTDPVQTLREQ